MEKRKYSHIIIVIILCISLLLCESCRLFERNGKTEEQKLTGKNNTQELTPKADDKEGSKAADDQELAKRIIEQDKFTEFLDNLFASEIQCDTLSLHYALAEPEEYGIGNTQITLGEYGIDQINEDLSNTEEYLKDLRTFDYELLTEDQQLTYKILERFLQQEIELYGYGYYNENLGPTTGFQAQLPLTLAEYYFYTKDDIEEYVKLLPKVYDYFEAIVQYEQEKSAQGLFMSDEVAQGIIDQCRAFIKNPEGNFLIEYFNEKMDAFSGLTEAEAEDYKVRNRDAVINYVIPAYQILADALSQLKGTGTSEGGLYFYPEGKEYYECYAKYLTGSDKNMREIINMLDSAINKRIAKITASFSDTTLEGAIQSFTSFPITDPKLIISDLQEKIKADFPEEVNADCKVEYVPESLSEYLSPAMYLIPPLDRYLDNCIYINGSDETTLSMIYSSVAHESYPGHLYQQVYFLSRNPNPVRYLMNFAGYIEGWATYAEMYSYHVSGIAENLADYMDAANVLYLCMYARTDIGINYEGWSKDRVISYFTGFNFDAEMAGEVYSTLLAEPALYLPYAVGYLEIIKFRDKAESKLGDEFDLKEFNQFLLEIGPAQFSIIADQEKKWIKEAVK